MGQFFNPSVMAGLQTLFKGFLQTEVTIYPRSSTSNSYSDDADEFGEPVTVSGWVREQPDTRLSETGGAVQTSETMRLHLPVDTVVDRGDKIEANGGRWRVIDHNRENTYRVSTRVACERMG